MPQILRVTIPFADFQKGDEITDPDLVGKYLAEQRAHVVPVNVEDEPEPEPAKD